jgi:hypothetical protein
VYERKRKRMSGKMQLHLNFCILPSSFGILKFALENVTVYFKKATLPMLNK